MQAQQQIRSNAAQLTAALVLITALTLGAFGGYLIATVARAPAAIPFAQQPVPQSPATQQFPASRLVLEQGRICTPDFICLEAQDSTVTPFTQQLPGSNPTFDEGKVCTPDLKTCLEGDSPPAAPLTQLLISPPTFAEGRMCTQDFKTCREPQNSYD